MVKNMFQIVGGYFYNEIYGEVYVSQAKPTGLVKMMNFFSLTRLLLSLAVLLREYKNEYQLKSNSACQSDL